MERDYIAEARLLSRGAEMLPSLEHINALLDSVDDLQAALIRRMVEELGRKAA
jgi:hypothetical protein